MPVLKVFIIGELKAALKELDTVFKYLKLDDRELITTICSRSSVSAWKKERNLSRS
jgi:hypothetical protein